MIDRALGCLFGAFIGDALGAFLEFNNNISRELLN
jgi:ADP-ribosylglycohydrolase